MSLHNERYQVALQQALTGRDEGGIPIGGALFLGDTLLGQGRNRRVQEDSPIIHGEIDVFRSAGRPQRSWQGDLTLYTTLSPCIMCAGASMIYGISTIVIGENRTFEASEAIMRASGIEIIVLDDLPTLSMFTEWTAANEELWFEDIPSPRRTS